MARTRPFFHTEMSYSLGTKQCIERKNVLLVDQTITVGGPKIPRPIGALVL